MRHNRTLLLFIFIWTSILSFLFINDDVNAFFSSSNRVISTFHVKEGASGDGSTWENACNLNFALANAVESNQIWVASGEYYPTVSADRAISFALVSGVALYGGFPSEGGAWEDRDPETHVTVLSGDIGVSDDINDNSYHVVVAVEVNSSTVLDGFTITKGNADGVETDMDGQGGGIYGYNNQALFSNLLIEGNFAEEGGGIYNETSFSESGDLKSSVRVTAPQFSQVTFSNNSAVAGGGGTGGGMYNLFSDLVMEDVAFISNLAAGGGGIFTIQSNLSITNALFSSNDSLSLGGGIYSMISDLSFINVTFSNNDAGDDGGGIYYDSGTINLTNVTMIDDYSGGMVRSCSIYNEGGNLTIINSIIRANSCPSDKSIFSPPYYTDISYSNIQDEFIGEGNINEYTFLLGPLADNGGYTMTHALLTGSPEIDTGSPTVCPADDQRGYYRPIDGDLENGARCDMGAYEFNSFLFGPDVFIYLPLVER